MADTPLRNHTPSPIIIVVFINHYGILNITFPLCLSRSHETVLSHGLKRILDNLGQRYMMCVQNDQCGCVQPFDDLRSTEGYQQPHWSLSN